jgi:hypothetical protein
MKKIRHRIKPYSLVILLIIVQTFTARDAFFYSDDFSIMERYANGYQGIFEFGNGHFAPLTNGLYYVMFTIFGLDSYVPFLCLAGLLNLYFGISLVEFFLKRNIFSNLNFAIVSVFIVVPFAAHTIYWVAAAVNLLVPSLLLNFLTCKYLKEKRTQKESLLLSFISLTIVGIGIGLGGYGLILIPSVFLLNFKLRNLIGTVLISFLILITLFVYSNSRTETFGLFSKAFPLWLSKSFFDFGNLIIPIFPDYNFLTQFILFGIALSLLYSLRKLFFALNPFKNQTYDFSRLAIVTAFITTITIMYRARGGVENFNASRYVVIMNFFLFSIMTLTVAAALKTPKITVATSTQLERVFLAVLIFVVISRVPLWHQASLDISYLGSINKKLVIAELCSEAPVALQTESASMSEGLDYFPATIDNEAWRNLKLENC